MPEDLWQAVQERLRLVNHKYFQMGKGRRYHLRDSDSRYLLSWFARCAQCNGPMTAIDRDYSRRGGLFYGCSHYRKRGSAICQNSLLIEQESLDTGVLEAISQAMDEKIISEAIDKFLMRMNPSDDDRLSRRRVLEKELSVTETHIQNLLNAISNGEKQPRALIARLNSEEARKDELTAQMNELSKVYPVQQLGTARLKRDGAKEFQT